MKPVYYANPPSDCDVCEAPITDTFVDGATAMGPWANMCPKCFRRVGRGLGTGRGQKYERQDDGRYLKVE